ncbi:MAG: type II toxin-antitoxin system VapC family toxin [Nitrospirota bacterium]
MKPTVYIETSVISYLTAKPSRDLIIAAHQQITIDWWETSLTKFDAFVSPVILEEVSRGDSEASRLRLEKISSFPVLEINPDVFNLAELYFSRLDIPDKARADAYHIALASWHGLDYLVSWNCTHIANGRVRMIIEEINSSQGIRTPVICTPEELMEV